MKELLLLGVLVFATGCGGLFDYSDLIDVEPEPSSSFTPEPEPELQALVLDDGTVVPVPTNDWMEPGESIAFIAADNGLVCRRLTVGGWDDVMLTTDGSAPRGVDIGGDGSILISDPDNIRRLLPDWSGVEELTAPIPGVELGEIGCDHQGNIVAAAKTAASRAPLEASPRSRAARSAARSTLPRVARAGIRRSRARSVRPSSAGRTRAWGRAASA